MRSLFLILLITTAVVLSAQTTNTMTEKNQKTDTQWQQELDAERYQVLRQCGTEAPFTGKYYKHDKEGSYHCAGCGAKLFSSETKYESGSGWPSFYDAVDSTAVKKVLDKTHGMIRTEIKCAKCDGHLGHIFNDGPAPSGMRYCVNSLSLEFEGEE